MDEIFGIEHQAKTNNMNLVIFLIEYKFKFIFEY